MYFFSLPSMIRYLVACFLFFTLIPMVLVRAEPAELSSETVLLQFSEKVQALHLQDFKPSYSRSWNSYWKYEDGNSYLYPVDMLPLVYLPASDLEIGTPAYEHGVHEFRSLQSLFRDLMEEDGFVANPENTVISSTMIFGETLEYTGYKKGNMGCYFGVFWFDNSPRMMCIADLTKPTWGTIYDLQNLYRTLGMPGEHNSTVRAINFYGDFWEIIESGAFEVGGTSALVKKEGDSFNKIYENDFPPCSVVWQNHVPQSIYKECEDIDHMKEHYGKILEKIRTSLSMHDSLSIDPISAHSDFPWIDASKNLQLVQGSSMTIAVKMNGTEEKTVESLLSVLGEVMAQEGFSEKIQQNSHFFGMGSDFPELLYRGYQKGHVKCIIEGSPDDSELYHFYLSCGYGQRNVAGLTTALDQKIRALLHLTGEHRGYINQVKHIGNFLYVNFQWRIGPSDGYILSEDGDGTLHKIFELIGDVPTIQDLKNAGVPEGLVNYY